MENLKNVKLPEDDEIPNLDKHELEVLLKQLKDVVWESKQQLKAIQDETQCTEKDIEHRTAERNRLKPLATRAAGLSDALRELDTVKQQREDLSRQLKEQKAASASSREDVENKLKAMEKGMKKELVALKKQEAALVTENKRVGLRCSKVQESLSVTLAQQQAAERELQQLKSDPHTTGTAQLQGKKGDELLDEYVAKLGIPATLGKAGIKPLRGKIVK
ncbi:golgin subfamily A member 6-like protein 7 [Amia ocellicauda]|uniref:golgin subfamily A member 6-like protein 7 n=1 Tax=Amia ocellicauda TaxID=2972642 RepID=UPI003464D813